MGRPPCCDKANVKRGLWTAEEDAKILAYVSNHGVGNWTLVPRKAGLNRCGKSCRLRWTNYLRPDLKHDDFTPQEEDLIINLHQAIGSRWSLIAKRLPGRTDNDVKNYWNTKLRKKLHKMGIDPVTHKPFSQIISDYGNISGLPNTVNQIGCFTRHLNANAVSPKLETSPTLQQQQQQSNANMSFNSDQVQENSSASTTLSWDLLATQFQLANLNTIQSHFLNTEANSSCSSSPSSNLTQLSSPMSSSSQLSQPPPPPQLFTASSASSWTDFLVTDPFPCANLPKQEDFYVSHVTSSTLPQSTFSCGDRDHNNFNRSVQDSSAFSGEANNYSEPAASSLSSFVESILDQDSQMRSQFPQLLDDSYDY